MPKSTAPAHEPMPPAQLEAVADMFGLLSEPSRLTILQVLQQGEASVGELVEQCGMKQANVSKQLSSLLAGGIVQRRQEGNFAFYSIAMPFIFDLCAVVCQGVAQQAAQRAAELQPAAPRTGNARSRR